MNTAESSEQLTLHQNCNQRLEPSRDRPSFSFPQEHNQASFLWPLFPTLPKLLQHKMVWEGIHIAAKAMPLSKVRSIAFFEILPYQTSLTVETNSDSFFMKYLSIIAVTRPSIIPNMAICSIAMAGTAIDNGYGAYRGTPSGPAAISG